MDEFANSLRTQGENYHWKAEYYRQNGELEGALINYLLSSNNLYNFKQYYEQAHTGITEGTVAKISQDDTNYVDNLLITNMKYIVPLQEKLKQIKKNRNCPEEDKDAELNCTEIKLVRKGDLRFQDVSGQFEAKNKIEQGILYPLIFPKLYPYISKGILFYGPPGTGKTLLAKAFANELQDKAKCYGMNVKVLFYAPTGGQLKGKYVGETEKNIEKYFDCASRQATACENSSKSLGKNTLAKFEGKEHLLSDGINKHQRVISVLFLDECEAIAGDRARDSTGLMSNSVNTLLQKMDGVSSYSNVVVMAATNYPWNLDDAVLRRFDTKIFITLPTKEDISSLIRIDIANYIKKILIPIKKDKQEIPVESEEGEKKCDKCFKGNIKGKWCWCCDGVCMDEETKSNGPSNEDIFKFYRKKYFNILTDQKINNIAAIYAQKLFSGSDASTAVKAVFKEMAVKSRDINRWITATIEDPYSINKTEPNIDKIKDIDKKGTETEKKFQLFSMTGIQSNTYNSKNKNGNDGEYALWVMPPRDRPDGKNYPFHVNWEEDVIQHNGFDHNIGYIPPGEKANEANTLLVNLQLMKKCGFKMNDTDNKFYNIDDKNLLNGFFNYFHKTNAHFVTEDKKTLHAKSLNSSLYLNWNIYYTNMFSTDNFLEIMLTIYSLSKRELINSKVASELLGINQNIVTESFKGLFEKYVDFYDKKYEKIIKYGTESEYITSFTSIGDRKMDNNHISIECIANTSALDTQIVPKVLGIKADGSAMNMTPNGISISFEKQREDGTDTIIRIMVPYDVINVCMCLGVFVEENIKEYNLYPIFYINTEYLRTKHQTKVSKGKTQLQTVEEQVDNVSILTANICAFKILSVVIHRYIDTFISSVNRESMDVNIFNISYENKISHSQAIAKYELYALAVSPDKSQENQILAILPSNFIESVKASLSEFINEYESVYLKYSEDINKTNLEESFKEQNLYIKGRIIASELYDKLMSKLFNILINNTGAFPTDSVKKVYDNITNILQSIHSSFALFSCAQAVYIDYYKFLYYMFRSVYTENCYIYEITSPAKLPIFNILVKIDVSKSLDVLQQYAIDGRIYLEIEFKAYVDYSNRLMQSVRRSCKWVKDTASWIGTDSQTQFTTLKKEDLLAGNEHMRNKVVEMMTDNISAHPDITKHLLLLASNILAYKTKTYRKPFETFTGNSCEQIYFRHILTNLLGVKNAKLEKTINDAKMMHILMNGIESYNTFNLEKATEFFTITIHKNLYDERSNIMRITPEFYTDPDYLTYMRVICFRCLEISIESVYKIGDNRQILINIITNKNGGNLNSLHYLDIDIRPYALEKKNLAYASEEKGSVVGWLSDTFYTASSKLRETVSGEWSRIISMTVGAAVAVGVAAAFGVVTLGLGMGALVALAFGAVFGHIAYKMTPALFVKTSYIYELLSCLAEGYLMDVNNNSSNNKCRFGWLVARALEKNSVNKSIPEITNYVKCIEEPSFTVTPDVFVKTENLVNVIRDQLGYDKTNIVRVYRFIYTYPLAFSTFSTNIPNSTQGGNINAYNKEYNIRSISRRMNKKYNTKRSIRNSSNEKQNIYLAEFEQPIIVHTGGQLNDGPIVKQDSWIQQGGGGENEDCLNIEKELAGKNPDDFITFELTESLFQNVIAPANPSKIKATITKKKMDVLIKYYNGEPLTEDEKAGKDEPTKK